MKNQIPKEPNPNSLNCSPNSDIATQPYIYTEEDLGEGLLDADVNLYCANCIS